MKLPIHLNQVPAQVWYAGTDREIRGKALCDEGGTAKVGVGWMELPPGSNTKPGHWHTEEDEHLFVLAGSATLHLANETFELRAGSYVNFPPGQTASHWLENTGREPFCYLMIGERIAGDRVTHTLVGLNPRCAV